MIFTTFMLYLFIGLFTVLSILCEARWTGSKKDYRTLYSRCTEVASFRGTWSNYTWILICGFWLWPAVYFFRWKDAR